MALTKERGHRKHVRFKLGEDVVTYADDSVVPDKLNATPTQLKCEFDRTENTMTKSKIKSENECKNIQEVYLDTKGISLLIQVEVNRVKIANAVVDTGAQATVVSERLANKLQLPQHSYETIKLRSAQKGTVMSGKMFKQLKLNIGSQSIGWDVVVAVWELMKTS